MWWTQTNVPFNETGSAANINNSWAHCLKEMLKGTITLSGSSTSSSMRPESSKWTVEGSCDGVNGLLDGIDRLTGSVLHSFDATKWVHAASGSAHSWIVLKSPTALGPLWLCIDANSATTTTWGIVYSREAFVPAFPTPPLTASRPISNMAYALNVSSDPGLTANAIMLSDQTTAQVWRAHISVDASGAFHYLTNRNAQGIFNYWMSCYRAVDKNSNDTRFDTFAGGDNSTTATIGAPSLANIISSGRLNGRSTDGADIFGAGGLCNWSFGASSIATATVDTSGSTTANIGVFPPYIWEGQSTQMCWRGRIPDTWIIPSTLGTGNGFPAAPPAQTHIIAGTLLVPFSLSASL